MSQESNEMLEIVKKLENTKKGTKYHEELKDFSMPSTNRPIKYVEMNDEWESYLVRFSIFWPIERDAE